MATHRDAAFYNSRILGAPTERTPVEISSGDELAALLQASLGARYSRDDLAKVAAVQHRVHAAMEDLGEAFDSQAIDAGEFAQQMGALMHAAMDELKAVMSREDLERVFDVAVDEPAAVIDEEALWRASDRTR